MPVIAGGTSLTAPDAAPASRLVTTAIPYLLGFAVMTVTAGLTYRQCTHDASWAIGPDYYSTYLRATLPLPGTGWRGHESLRMNRTNDGDRWARLEGFYRGGEVDDPGEALMVLRVHAPGMFPEEVDMEQFRGQIDTLSRQIVASAGDIQTAGLDCTLEPRVRTEPAGKCRGPGTFHSEPVEIYMFYWEDTVDDVMAVIYLAKGERLDGKVAELETFIHDIQVE